MFLLDKQTLDIKALWILMKKLDYDFDEPEKEYEARIIWLGLVEKSFNTVEKLINIFETDPYILKEEELCEIIKDFQ